MSRSTNLVDHPYLGKGEQRVMRQEALKRIAEEAGFVYEGGPSVSRWLQHLADEKIREEGTGYYAVLTHWEHQRCLVFLSRRPVQEVSKRILLPGADGILEYWGHGRYLELCSENGAREMLRAYGVEIANDDAVLHDTYYAFAAGEPEPKATPPVGSGIAVPAVIHSRFLRLLKRRCLRDEREWTMAEISAETGLGEARLWSHATDRVRRFNVRSLDLLCRFLGCSIGELLVITDAETEPKPEPGKGYAADREVVGLVREPKVIHSRVSSLLAQKRLRDDREWLVSEVQVATGLPPRTLLLHRRDTVTRFDVRTLDALCRFFECTISELLAITQVEAEPKPKQERRPRPASGLKRKTMHSRFGILLARKRERDGLEWTLGEVEAETGVKERALTSYAEDTVKRYDIRTLGPLCKFFGCAVSELLSITEVES